MSKRTLQDQPASDFDGVAIMLVPQDEDAANIAPHAAVKQEHLHCTLAFLGDAKPLLERGYNCTMLASALMRVAHDYGPVEASLGGITRFSVPGDGPDPLVLNVNSKGVHRMRDAVLYVLSLFSIEEATEHGYTPHMTLGYLPKKNIIPMKRWEPMDIIFDRIRVGFGGEEVDLPLDSFGGPIRVKAAPEGDGIPALPGEDDRSEVDECRCCGGMGEHKDGHECYVCDSSGQESEAQGQVCEGHHGRPDDGSGNARERYGDDFVHKADDYDCTGLVEMMMDEKGIRRVRTPEGAAMYGQPIGSIITRDAVPDIDLSKPKTVPTLASDLKPGDHVIHDDESHEVTDVIPVDEELSIALKSDRTGKEKAVRKSPTSIFAKIVLGAAAAILAAMAAINGGQMLGEQMKPSTEDRSVTQVEAPKDKVKSKPAPTTVKGYEKMFRSIDTDEWGAADISISHQMPDGRRVWLYGDTLSGNNGFVHSTAIVQDGGNVHVSDGGKQLLPDGGKDPADKSRDLIYWIDSVEQGPTDDTLIIGAMEMSIGDDNPWDFRIASGEAAGVAESRQALVSVDAEGNLTFEEWKGWAVPPVENNPHLASDLKIVGDSHWTYGEVTHDIELGNGAFLTTVSQNWDDDFSEHMKPDGTLRYQDWRPIWGSTAAQKSERGDDVEQKAVPLKCGGCQRTFYTDATTDWACPNCGHKGQEAKDVSNLSPGLNLGSRMKKARPVVRSHRFPVRKRAARLVRNSTQNVQIKATPKDGDGDGWIDDGLPTMRPAPAVVPSLGDLTMEGPSDYGKEYGLVADKHDNLYVVGPDPEDPGFFAAGANEDGEMDWDDLVVQEAADLDEALGLLDARTRQPRKPGAEVVKGSLSDSPTKINRPKRSSSQREADAAATREAQSAAAAKKAAKATRAEKAAQKATAAKKASSPRKRAEAASTAAKKASSPKKAAAKKATPKPKAKKEWKPGDPYRQVDKGKDVMGEQPINVPKGDIEETYNRTFIVPKRQKLDVPIIKPGSKTDQELRRQFVIPPAYTRVRYNVHRDENAPDSDYNGLLYEAFDPHTGKWQAVYSTRHWIRQANAKFAPGTTTGDGEDGDLGKVATYIQHRDKIIDRFIKDAASKDPKVAEPARALLLQAISGIRAGTPHKKGEAPINRRFGASTLEARHVKFNSDGSITLSFMAKGTHQRYEMSRGKPKLDANGKPIPILDARGRNKWPGKPYSVTFTDARVTKMLKAQTRGKTGEDELFGASATQMNRYFDNIQRDMKIKAGLTTHNLRHGVATLSATAAIKKIKTPKTEEEYLDALTEACQTAAISINDSAKVAFRSYIDHNLWMTWTKGHPEWVKLEPREFKK